MLILSDKFSFDASCFGEPGYTAIGHTAWEGFKRTGEKGAVGINFTKVNQYSIGYRTRHQILSFLEEHLSSAKDFAIEQASDSGQDFDEDLFIQDYIYPLACVEHYDPATEIVMWIRDPFGGFGNFPACFDENGEKKGVMQWVLHKPDKAVTDYHLDYVKSQEVFAPRKPKKQPEAQLEYDLYCWLIANGVDVQKQVSTQKHRLDLWIPGKLMIELKAGKVSGDDICQAIDYHATYEKQILIVGKGMSDAASRGMDGFNKSTGAENIVFVSWGAVKTYLSAILKLS